MSKNTPDDIAISFTVGARDLEKIENHVDSVRMKLRKQNIRFSKKEMYVHLILKGVEHFSLDAFVKSLPVIKSESNER